MLGIVIGCTIVAVILLIAIGGAFFCKKRQRRNDAAARPREQYAALTLQAPAADYADVADVRAPVANVDDGVK